MDRVNCAGGGGLEPGWFHPKPPVQEERSNNRVKTLITTYSEMKYWEWSHPEEFNGLFFCAHQTQWSGWWGREPFCLTDSLACQWFCTPLETALFSLVEGPNSKIQQINRNWQTVNRSLTISCTTKALNRFCNFLLGLLLLFFSLCGYKNTMLVLQSEDGISEYLAASSCWMHSAPFCSFNEALK